MTGGGFISDKGGRDNFGGNAKSMKDGRIQGEWNHVDHESGEHIHGRPSYLFCRQIDEAGPGNPGGKKGFKMNQVFFGGDARLQLKGAWTDGFWFDAMAKDHGEGKNVEDAYEITVRQKVDPTAAVSGSIVYQTVSNAPLVGGNVQLHPPNGGHPYSSTTIPSWVKL